MFSEQPQPTITSASLISSAASGEANPPLTSRFHGLPRNSPLATAEVASSAPHASASRSRSAGPAPGAAARDEHRPPGPAQHLGQRGDRLGGRGGREHPPSAGTGPGSHVGPAWTFSGRARTTVRRPSAVA